MRWLSLLLLLPISPACGTSPSAGRRAPQKATVLFLCSYGGAKSVIAASYFNRLAAETGLDYIAIAAAAEDPYPAVLPAVADFLQSDGFDVRAFKPRHVEERDVSEAAKIVSIDCDLSASGLADSGAERWDDVPKVSEDLPGSAAAIRRHVEALARTLRGRR
jgi:arsenate reductase (thioredoxin)